jgi:hypothetical protein
VTRAGLTAAQRALLEEVSKVTSHGAHLPAGPTRDRLRAAGLIIGFRTRIGHGKSWYITPAGRTALAATDAPSQKGSE